MTTLTGDSFTAGIEWNLAEIRTKVRNLIMRPSTSQVSNDDLDEEINDYYQNDFPYQIQSDLLRSTASLSMSPTDSGVYDLNADILKIFNAKTEIQDIILYTQRENFYETYPDIDSGAFVTTPDGAQLTYGSSDNKKVKNSAFHYTIEGYTYYKTSAETIMSGNTVPASTYGAYRIEIDTSGTIYVIESSDNSTGYVTPRKAIEGLTIERNDRACMGFIVVTGSYVPGTTALTSASFCDGKYSLRNVPEACLIYQRKVTVYPKPNDQYQFTCGYIKKPTYFSGNSSVPLDNAWGPIISYGTAIKHFESKGEIQKAAKLIPELNRLINLLSREKFNQSTKMPLARF